MEAEISRGGRKLGCGRDRAKSGNEAGGGEGGGGGSAGGDVAQRKHQGGGSEVRGQGKIERD